MRLTKLANAVEGRVIIGETECEREITNLCMDSRKRMDGGLFFCLRGENADGHDYADESVKNGAVAIVCERPVSVNVPQIIVKNVRESLGKIASAFYGNPAQKMKIIAITGTNGKTTTSYMLAEILKKAGKKVGVIGTLGAVYGRKKLPPTLTTPDPIELHKIFADMLLCGTEYVIMEVSAHALHYYKTEGIPFVTAIFTNFTQDHLDFFKDMDAYKRAKLRLFQEKSLPVAVLNGDDGVGREIGEDCEKVGIKTVYYGLNTPVDAFAIVTDESLKRTECMLNINDELCRISLLMTGRHNVYNALAAAVCAMELGIETGAIAEGLSKLCGVEGRLQRVGAFNGGEIYVDFAHTPDGLANSLEALKPHCRGRLICLFGCGGNRDKSKRAVMGETAAKKSDFSVLTSDNPRYEDPLDIIGEIEKGYRRFSPRYVIVPDRKRALEYALDILKKGDVLLVAGKGGEQYQEIMGIKYPFNDHDSIIELLEQKGKTPQS
ncbi:MAG: UDP-N-acetylmuramoyl-L-alanyl-D-glutamate--2,6-diaminopimelate ligase [Clostridiales bacterium]|nr:UDP-N-acetylmuramoyl-L-alanyl-D-glutamate--2,6-diaminopimelate ligase [Clostridiales bacterium]